MRHARGKTPAANTKAEWGTPRSKQKGKIEMLQLPQIDPEFRGLMPPLSEDEYSLLDESIASSKKCHEAILVWEGVIVDGCNRFEICLKHEVEFQVRDVCFDSREDAKIWILGNQLGRRNLTDAMRIELVLVKAKLLEEKAKKRQSLGGRPRKEDEKGLTKKTNAREGIGNVRTDLAKEAGVGEGTLERYMHIREDGSPELLEQVKRGEVKIGTAFKMLSREIVKQLRGADKYYTYIAEHAPFENDPAANGRVHEELKGLARQLRELITKCEDTKRSKNRTGASIV